MYKLLDLYCSAGGAGMGYHNAGFEVTGVDCFHQKNYPFKFIQAPALWYLKRHWHEYDVIHASPHCQGYSRTKSLHKNKYPLQIIPLRKELLCTGKPYIIENVPGAPLINPIVLNGIMFNLKVIRNRLFESNIKLIAPEKGIKKGTVGGKNFTRKNPGYYFIVGGHQAGTLTEWNEAMGINWMNKKELAQAIPPAYTEYIGKQLITFLNNTKCKTFALSQQPAATGPNF